MPNVIKSALKATIIQLIVALFITSVILILSYLCFGATLRDNLSLINKISIDISQKEEVKEMIITEEKKIINYPEYGTKYATIEIPKIDVNLPVFFGDTLEILKKGVGHSSGSYFPGEGGSIVYLGHNFPKFFRRFSELQIGNEIIVKTSYGEFKYKIYDMQIIKETELEKVPIQDEKEILMVYTCYPFNNVGYASQRYVVYAELEN